MKTRTFIALTIFACLVLSFAIVVPVKAVNTTEQILTQIDDILAANPLKATEKAQIINVAQDDTVTVNVARAREGAGLKPHIHKTHDEMIYIIKGTGQMFINGKWIDVKPGTVHFNPMNKVHATRNTGKEDLVLLSIFTPAMKEPDRHYVDEK
jgi:mannose-6-phosphate isomerase-like protein (cupin superfamily)